MASFLKIVKQKNRILVITLFGVAFRDFDLRLGSGHIGRVEELKLKSKSGARELLRMCLDIFSVNLNILRNQENNTSSIARKCVE